MGAIELLGADKGAIGILDTQGVLKIEAHQGFKKELLDFFEVSGRVI